MAKRRKFVTVDPEWYRALGHVGIDDPVVLVCDDLQVTASVTQLEKVPQTKLRVESTPLGSNGYEGEAA